MLAKAHVMKYLFFALIILTPSWASAVCDVTGAVATLRSASPDGYRVYQASRRNSEVRGTFDRHIHGPLGCDPATAIHEAVHILGPSLGDKYYLLNGSTVDAVPESRAFFAPGALYERFRGQPYANDYLSPGASSSSKEQLSILFDELNSYTWDAHVTMDLAQAGALGRGETLQIHGMAYMMAFISAYFDRAKKDYPRAMSAAVAPETRSTIRALWAQAVRSLQRACLNRGFRRENHLDTVRMVCALPRSGGLAEVLGQPLACPENCGRLLGGAQVASPAAAPAPARPRPIPPAAVVRPAASESTGFSAGFLEETSASR